MRKKKTNEKWSALPFRPLVGKESQPVFEIQWIKRSKLRANGYNPNHVAPPELDLLQLSILRDGWTQPIVLRRDFEIVDGYHRYLVSAQPDVSSLTGGLVPVVFLREGLTLPEQMASTIRHNRARGVHAIIPMARVVGEMRKQGIKEEDIQKELGMDFEEYDRLFVYGRKGMPEQVGSEEFGHGWKPKEKKKDVPKDVLKTKNKVAKKDGN